MELFEINRYNGENEDPNKSPSEKKIKKKLLKKIEERKRSHLSQFEENESETVVKKRKYENSDATDIKIKKKKKDKKKDLSDNECESSKEPLNLGADELEAVQNSKTLEENKNEDTSEENDEEHLNKNQEAFTILKNIHMSEKKKVKRKLPDWLANPSVVSIDLKNLTHSVDSIPELDKIFVDKLKINGITHFFPVQHQIIPCLLENERRPYMFWPNDICVSAPTGSGKTLAFVLPILQVLHKRVVPKIRALVVLPVQDLANQVFKVFEKYAQPTNLKVLLFSKMRSYDDEQKLIYRYDDLGNHHTLIDIIVTTPGRLVEHLTKTKEIDFSELKFLVIDEADRVMENVQNDWLYHLNKYINAECTKSYQVPVITYSNMIKHKRPPNKLLFSATLSQDPEKLQVLGLFHPKLFTSVVKSDDKNIENVEDETKFIGKYTTPAELKEYYTVCTKANKPLLVHHLIMSKSWNNVLCFVNSSKATSKLAFVLKNLSKNKKSIKQLSANLTIYERNQILQKFSKGEIDVLISSDALSRGIDVPNVKYVISYDCPKFVKTYVHRIGRTGRAGKEGTSLTVLTSKEVNSFNKIISSAGKPSVENLNFREKELKQYSQIYEKTLKSLMDYMKKLELQSIAKIKKSKKVQSLAARGSFLKKKKHLTKRKKNL